MADGEIGERMDAARMRALRLGLLASTSIGLVRWHSLLVDAWLHGIGKPNRGGA